MRRVAVFGNAGGGKSIVARGLAEATGLPLYALDLIQFRAGGEAVLHEEYLKVHADLLGRDRWIIDGFGCMASAMERFAAADTLVYIDLPLVTHYWWTTKRFLTAPFLHPEGWPADSPISRSTLHCYRVLWRCHRGLTPRYRQLVADGASAKRVHHLRSPAAMQAFLAKVRQEQQRT